MKGITLVILGVIIFALAIWVPPAAFILLWNFMAKTLFPVWVNEGLINVALTWVESFVILLGIGIAGTYVAAANLRS